VLGLDYFETIISITNTHEINNFTSKQNAVFIFSAAEERSKFKTYLIKIEIRRRNYPINNEKAVF